MSENKLKILFVILSIAIPLTIASIFILQHNWPEFHLLFSSQPYNPWKEIIGGSTSNIVLFGVFSLFCISILKSNWINKKPPTTKKTIKLLTFICYFIYFLLMVLYIYLFSWSTHRMDWGGVILESIPIITMQFYLPTGLIGLFYLSLMAFVYKMDE